MRREDVRPLLEQAAAEVPEPDLADAAWAGGLAIRRRRRRSTAVVLVVVLLVLATTGVVVAVKGPGAGLSAPEEPPPVHPPGYVPPVGQIAGMDLWVAPQGGSERFLDRLPTPLGGVLRYPDNPEPLEVEPMTEVAAVVLARTGGNFRPLLLGGDSRWAEVDVLLAPIATGEPLSTGAVAPNGTLVAFPQPQGVVVVDAASAEVRQLSVPDTDIRSVAWLSDSEQLLVAGPRSTYRLNAAGTLMFAMQTAVDPDAATAPYRLDGVAGQVKLWRSTWDAWAADEDLRLPVTEWSGQTFTSGNVAARVFTADRLPAVPTQASRPQVVAAISAVRDQPSRLLALGETPQPTPPPTGTTPPLAVREPGCCAVLGWYDAGTVLFRVTGWILGWSLQTGQVRRVTELEVAGVALGPGIRS